MENTITSVNYCSETECKAIAVYFYRLIIGLDDFSSHEECQKLYNALVRKLGLENHARKVLDAFIEKLVKQKKLEPLEEKKCMRKRNPFESKTAPKVMYSQDEDIFANCGQFSTNNADEIDLVRCTFYSMSDNSNFPKIAGCVFFGKKSEDGKFKIPREIRIPADYLKACSDSENVEFLKNSLKLSEEEMELLNCTYRTNAVRELYDVADDLNRKGMDRISTYAQELGKQKKEVKKLLSSEEKLHTFGFIGEDGEFEKDAMDCIESRNLNLYFSDIIRKEKCENTFQLESFSVKKEKTLLIRRLLESDTSSNILLYGAPGSGKTEYAKSLVKAGGLKPLIYKNELEVKSEDSESNTALYRLNCLLSVKQENCVIIVDEAESILKTLGSFFGMRYSLSRKGTVNKMLEASENKVIWIMNYTNELDESTLRRFTYSLRFADMPKTMLRSIAETKLKDVKMPENLKGQLVDLFGLYHVTGSSVDNMVKTVKGMHCTEKNADTVLKDVKDVLEANSQLIFGKEKMRELVNPSYDLSVLNTSIPAEEMLEMVQSAAQYEETERTSQSGIRMLFYGASGTGKTELVRYLAEKLNKKILLKRASDIMGKYVGESEKNIRDAFAEAEASDAILLFDEADSFFADRETANQSWERTIVNEFLTQMEEFSGILVCTTNLRKIMDPAMQRRFHIMTEFKPLKKEGIEKLLTSFFGTYSFTEEEVARISSCETVTPGDFGSLSGKMRFVPASKKNSEYIISGLLDLQKEKQGTKSIGFAG